MFLKLIDVCLIFAYFKVHENPGFLKTRVFGKRPGFLKKDGVF